MLFKKEEFKLIFKKKIFWLIFILFIAGFSLRLFLTDCYYWDELVYLQHSEILSGKTNNYNEFYFRPPILPILIAGLYVIWHNPLIANIFVSLLASSTIILAYFAGKEMFNKKIGVIAAVLLTFWPIHIQLSKSILVHTTAMFFAFLFLFLLKKAEKENKILLWITAGISLGIAILTRFTYLILVPLVLVNIFLFKKKYNMKNILYSFFGFLISFLPYLSWAFIVHKNPIYPFQAASMIVSWSTKQPWHLYLTKSWILLGLSGTLGLCFWLFSLRKRKISKNEIFLLSWILVPLIYLSRMPHKEIRFMVITLIPIIFLSSIGWDYLLKLKIKKIVIAIFIIVLFLPLFFLNVFTSYARICDTDSQKVSEWIMENTNDEDLIYVQHEFAALGYYTNKEINIAPFIIDEFFNKTSRFMIEPGYYIYFGMQEKNELLPSKEEVEEDYRFKLIENIEKVYVYKYK